MLKLSKQPLDEDENCLTTLVSLERTLFYHRGYLIYYNICYQ